MKLSQQQQRFALDVSRLISFINGRGYSCTFGEAYRTPEQAEIYAKDGRGIKDSLHCKRLAIDLNLFDMQGNYISDSAGYQFFGEFWEKLDPLNQWGGRFPAPRVDGNHFERKES